MNRPPHPLAPCAEQEIRRRYAAATAVYGLLNRETGIVAMVGSKDRIKGHIASHKHPCRSGKRLLKMVRVR